MKQSSSTGDVFRPNRSAENAIAQYYLRIQTMYLRYVLYIDVKGFFDNVNHVKLLKQMWTLRIRDKKLLKIIRNPAKGESVEYSDSRISVYIAQKRKCAAMDEELEIGQMHCHHVKPKSLGGEDRYSNLKYVGESIHIIIHATKEETVDKYMKRICLTDTQMKKLNVLRSKAGNPNLIDSSKR